MKRRIDPTIIIILAIMLYMNYRNGAFSNPREWILSMLIMLPGIIVGLSFHEFAHGFVSYKLGDPTPKIQGRVTINPMAHIEPVGFIALLLCGFGWGIPVSIDPTYYKHKRRDKLLVSLAGVVMNLIIAVVFAFFIRLLFAAGIEGSDLGDILIRIFVQVAIINLVLMIFNLIPVPPLDGFGIITQIFDLRKYDWYYKVYNNGFYILLVLILFGITDRILSPAVSAMWGILCKYIIGIY